MPGQQPGKGDAVREVTAAAVTQPLSTAAAAPVPAPAPAAAPVAAAPEAASTSGAVAAPVAVDAAAMAAFAALLEQVGVSARGRHSALNSITPAQPHAIN